MNFKDKAESTARESWLRARIAAMKAKAEANKARAGAHSARAKFGRETGESPGKAIGAAGAAAASGAAGAFFLDPSEGKRRRHMARDKVVSYANKAADRMRKQATHRRNQVEGKVTEAKQVVEKQSGGPAESSDGEIRPNVGTPVIS